MNTSAKYWLRLLVGASYYSAYLGFIVVGVINIRAALELMDPWFALQALSASLNAIVWIVIYAQIRSVMDLKVEMNAGLLRIANLLLISVGFEVLDQIGVLGIALPQLMKVYQEMLNPMLSGYPPDQALARLDLSTIVWVHQGFSLPWLYPMTSGVLSLAAVLLIRVYCSRFNPPAKHLDAMPS